MFFGRAPVMVSPREALPGRPTPLPGVPERHAVLDAPLHPPFGEGVEVVYVAMGCFWGAERIMWQLPGVVSTAVGYAGGYTPNPTYEETCTGRTGHTESVLVAYDPARVSIERILATFWENHDPTTANRQGNDVGTQYRSAIYWTTPEQRIAAHATRDAFSAELARHGRGSPTTELAPFVRSEGGRSRGAPRRPVLLRGGLPPAVPPQEPARLLQPRPQRPDLRYHAGQGGVTSGPPLHDRGRVNLPAPCEPPPVVWTHPATWVQTTGGCSGGRWGRPEARRRFRLDSSRSVA